LDFGVSCGFQSMEDLGLWNQAWMWVLSQKHILAWAHTAACGSRERLAFLVDRHWPAVSRGCATSSRLTLAALRQWRGCMARGVLAVASLGPAAVFVILWSFFVCMTSPACALYALLSLVRAQQILLALLLLDFSSDLIYRIRILGDGF
jgi:DnaJ homolog subfamily C member 14